MFDWISEFTAEALRPGTAAQFILSPLAGLLVGWLLSALFGYARRRLSAPARIDPVAETADRLYRECVSRLEAAVKEEAVGLTGKVLVGPGFVYFANGAPLRISYREDPGFLSTGVALCEIALAAEAVNLPLSGWRRYRLARLAERLNSVVARQFRAQQLAQQAAMVRSRLLSDKS